MRKNTRKFADEIAELMEQYGFEFDDAYAVAIYASENEFIDDEDVEDVVDDNEYEDEDEDEEFESDDESSDGDYQGYEASVTRKNAIITKGRLNIPAAIMKEFAEINNLDEDDSIAAFLSNDKIALVPNNVYTTIMHDPDYNVGLNDSLNEDTDIDFFEECTPYGYFSVGSTTHGKPSITTKTIKIPASANFNDNVNMNIDLINIDDTIAYILISKTEF